MSKHINITSKTYYSRSRVTAISNQWNYYLSYNKYPIAIYFSYYSDSNQLVHSIRQQLIHVGGKGYSGSAAQHMYINAGLSWVFLTKGNIFTLFFPTWTVFTKFMQSNWGVTLNNKLSLITLSIQGNYVNVNYKLGIKQILEMGDNYVYNLNAVTHHLYAAATAFAPSLTFTIYLVTWVITYMYMCLVMSIHLLTSSVIQFQEYRSTLLTTTNHSIA